MYESQPKANDKTASPNEKVRESAQMRIGSLDHLGHRLPYKALSVINFLDLQQEGEHSSQRLCLLTPQEIKEMSLILVERRGMEESTPEQFCV